ncbi:MAG: hypothetical protein NZX77_06140 [Polyangiaceae bacterium]|nr:hypothetical protein [Polyangiaceae bacterium]
MKLRVQASVADLPRIGPATDIPTLRRTGPQASTAHQIRGKIFLDTGE